MPSSIAETPQELQAALDRQFLRVVTMTDAELRTAMATASASRPPLRLPH